MNKDKLRELKLALNIKLTKVKKSDFYYRIFGADDVIEDLETKIFLLEAIEELSPEIKENLALTVASEMVNKKLVHHKEGGININYDCVGVASVFLKKYADRLGKKIYLPAKVEKVARMVWSKLLEKEQLPDAYNSPYNKLGMWDLLHLHSESVPDFTPGQTLAIWQKGAGDHGHVIVYLDKKTWLSGTTNTGKRRKNTRIIENKDFSELNEFYKGKYGKEGKIVNIKMI